jgi:hypothetical protein
MKVEIHHLGLGDAITLAGATAKLAEVEPIIFPCFERDLISVRDIFSTTPNVVVTPIKKESEMFLINTDCPRLLTGYYGSHYASHGDVGFDQWFYDQLGVAISEKWGSFPNKEVVHYRHRENTNINAEKWYFVHQDPSRGFKMDLDRVPKGTWVPLDGFLSGSILKVCPCIRSAKEIHLINSAFLALCEVMVLREEQPKFLHRYARPWARIDMPKLRHNWTILD